MSSSVRMVVGLVAGLLAGIAVATAGNLRLVAAADALGLVGELWLNALRMTVLPLLVALLVTGIAATRETAASGRLAGRTLGLFAVIVAGSALFAALMMPPALTLWPVGPAARAGLLAGVPVDAAIPAQPPLRE